MVSEEVIRDRKGKSIMGRDHDAEASTSGDSHKFSVDCTRERFQFLYVGFQVGRRSGVHD